jgi:hypothetical protein
MIRKNTALGIAVALALAATPDGNVLAQSAPAPSQPAPTQVTLPEAAAGEPVAEQAPPEAPAPAFSVEQIEQMVSPIALYPDALLTQILMASTYPLEVVQADRWAKKNASLQGEALDEALKSQQWDPSVASLTHFPTVLARMSENLDWTQDMGDAFLAQKDQVLDAVQKLRTQAYAAGNLKSGEQQKIIVEKETQVIKIEPAQPEVVYVPQYTTAVYAASPPPVQYYPTVNTYSGSDMVAASMLSFGVGMLVGGALWGDCDWDHHDVYYGHGYGGGHNDVNINVGEVNVNRGRQEWNHNPEHRAGVRYRDNATRNTYASKAAARPALSRDAARGYGNASPTSAGAGNRLGGAGSGVAANRAPGAANAKAPGKAGTGSRTGMAKAPPPPGAGTGQARAGTKGSAPGASAAGKATARTGATTDRARASAPTASARGAGSTAFGGMDSGAGARAASTRGAASRGGSSGGFGGGSGGFGGGSRGGGGGGGGGGSRGGGGGGRR